jgi:hypothetical protein
MGLNTIPPEYGVEIDVRDYNGEVIIEHDPFIGGLKLIDYIIHYRHSFLIVNVKSEGIENEVIKILGDRLIRNYFFLDSTVPVMVKLGTTSKIHIATRVSEFEPLSYANAMSRIASWIWLDCFNNIPIDSREFQDLKNMGYKICIVSPDLQGRGHDIDKYCLHYLQNQMIPHAICAKIQNIESWKPLLMKIKNDGNESYSTKT